MTEPTGTSQTEDVRIMIEQLVKSLVDESDQVSVNLVEEPGETVLELEVAPQDVGRVIGKQGRTVRAMRNILSAAGVRSNKRFGLEIIEDDLAEDETAEGEIGNDQTGRVRS
ncbi:MAG: KH domain-containing protein [Terriglobales bacterium]